MMNSKNIHPFWRAIGYVLLLHLLCLLSLSLCRIVFIAANLPAEGIDWTLLPTALLIGVKFDNLIASYLTALPLLVLSLGALCTMHATCLQRWMPVAVKVTAWYYAILYTPLLFTHVANARYYHFFENHLNIGVTEWFGFVDETAGLLFDDPTNWIFLMIALAMIVLFVLAVSLLAKRFAQGWQPRHTSWQQYLAFSLISILLWGGCFCGMRGSFQRYPLKVSFAYFCNSPFYNKVGVNPVFNIIKSAETGKNATPPILAAIDEQQALQFVQEQLHITPQDSLRPLLRPGNVQRLVEGQPNVVLIFMESMTIYNLERQGNGQWLTPYLRSLRDKSIYFPNCFSTGIHTNNGIVGVHYGFVPNFANTIMDVNSDLYTGLPYYLQQNGYATLCFVTGNPQYDNMNSFWRDNGIEQIYSLYDYPPEAAVNNFGVPDGYMLDFGLRKLAERSKDGHPFFASFLTVSNHGPYVIPDAFRSRGNTEEEQIIAYADDAIRRFMEAAEQTEWGRNTIFVLVADHGTPLPSPYEMTFPYNAIPLFIYSPLLQPQQIDRVTSQIDIWETVLSLLGIAYDNNCLGIDALNESRPYAFFVSNEHLGVSDGEWFWCYGLQSQQEHLYRIGSGEDLLQQESERAAAMRTYGLNMQRVNLMAIEKKWTEPCK